MVDVIRIYWVSAAMKCLAGCHVLAAGGGGGGTFVSLHKRGFALGKAAAKGFSAETSGFSEPTYPGQTGQPDDHQCETPGGVDIHLIERCALVRRSAGLEEAT